MKTFETTKIELNMNKEEINRFLFKSYTVDSNGNTLDETEFDSDSNVVYTRIYRYFDTGELKSYIEYDPLHELLERQTYIKNDLGEIDKIEFEFIDGQKSIKEYSDTELGNACQVIIRNEEGEITGYELYTINKDGQVTKEIEMDEDKTEISKFIKSYSENGLLKEERHYMDKKLVSVETFEYDEKGFLIKKIHINHPDNFEVIDEYKYDLNNNLIYNSSNQNGTIIFENKCSYNSNNELVFEEFYELDFWEKRIVKHERLIHEIK